MTKNKIKILIIGFIVTLISGFGFYNFIEAAGTSTLYISPSSLTKNINEIFEISVNINPANQKVCVVEGQLIFNQLSCQAIDIKEGILSQSSPSCSSSYFLLGIPDCTTNDKALFTIKVKGEKAGNATANFTKVDIIGEGVSISSASLGGSYTLISPVPSCTCTAWSSWQVKNCGEGNCSSNQKLQTRTRTCFSAGCNTETENKCVEDSTCLSSQVLSEQPVTPEENVIVEGPSVPEQPSFPEGEAVRKGLLASIAVVLQESALKIISLIFLLIIFVYIVFKKFSIFSLRKKQ